MCVHTHHTRRPETFNIHVHGWFRVAALVNKGNVLFKKGDHEKAREYYKEALSNDSSCVEALYNLGNSSLSP